ncbi:MAG TPA: mercury resistance system periplasmic binding protein MerP [Casimicrobiaceae bacterium]|jgi:mercuric ion binding protein|nr:mercury resistance system periplasmic binding protein MerP [Casimicrobiaceae bacterium]
MKALRTFAAATVLAVLSVGAFAAPRTVTLQVSGMVCPACPMAVKKALQRVDGVVKADVSFENKQAIVTFDDVKTNEQSLLKATAEAGFRSAIKTQ